MAERGDTMVIAGEDGWYFSVETATGKRLEEHHIRAVDSPFERVEFLEHPTILRRAVDHAIQALEPTYVFRERLRGDVFQR